MQKFANFKVRLRHPALFLQNMRCIHLIRRDIRLHTPYFTPGVSAFLLQALERFALFLYRAVSVCDIAQHKRSAIFLLFSAIRSNLHALINVWPKMNLCS
jgi:hypothetical protein